MGSCISSKNPKKLAPIITTTTTATEKPVINSIQPTIWKVPSSGNPSKDEQFFDSKAWLESDDEDFLSVNGDNSPAKEGDYNSKDEHKGRRLSDLFKDPTSFNRDSQASLKAEAEAEAEDKEKAAREKSVKRCLPSLVRTLSCGDRRKKRSNHVSVAVAV